MSVGKFVTKCLGASFAANNRLLHSTHFHPQQNHCIQSCFRASSRRFSAARSAEESLPPDASEFPEWAYQSRDFFRFEIMHQSEKSQGMSSLSFFNIATQTSLTWCRHEIGFCARSDFGFEARVGRITTPRKYEKGNYSLGERKCKESPYNHLGNVVLDSYSIANSKLLMMAI